VWREREAQGVESTGARRKSGDASSSNSVLTFELS